MNSIKDFLNGYYDSLKAQTITAKADGGWTYIETPFVGLFNDMICLYARFDGDSFEFSDGGETLSNLETSGVSLRTARNIIMRSICSHGVEICKQDGTECICVKSGADEAFERYHDILSCLIYLNGLDILAKSEPVAQFKREVDAYFSEHNIGVIPGLSMKGETGVDYDFDFGISGKSECLLIKSFNVFTNPQASTFQIGIEEIRADNIRKIRALAILNERKPINPALVKLLEKRGTRCLRWSERDTDEALKLFKVA